MLSAVTVAYWKGWNSRELPLRKDRIAEWILQLVCPSARAESTVGDLMESAATRGDVWFWANVWRTAVALLWDGVRSDPRKMLGLAVRGFLFSLWLLVAFFLGFLVLLLVYGIAIGTTAHPGGQVPDILGPVTGRTLKAISDVILILCQFLVGRWVARRAPGRELAACLATILMPWAFGFLVELAVALATKHSWMVNYHVQILYQIPCLLGAVWVRKRATS